MKQFNLTYLIILLIAGVVSGQTSLEFDGELSAWGNYSPDSELDYSFGGRYLPKLSLEIPIRETRIIDFEAAANIYGSFSFNDFDSIATHGDIRLYRLWARYTGKRFEFRLGLQKIDFGSAMLLRPLQWFDEIDPRDPLKFTNGIYGALARYYFLNNANIWLWILYGNENPRGFTLLESNPCIPEFGGRFQYPVPRGEIAFSYHHRIADSRNWQDIPQYERIPENRFALDGKWDLEVGMWFEASYVQKKNDVDLLTNQEMLTMGMDYTFGVGNGMHIILEHLLAAYDDDPFAFKQNYNTTALSVSYPLGLYNNISAVGFYNWNEEALSFFLNYQHTFKNITSYIMAFYNPDVNQQIVGENNFSNNFPGPGVRLMIVFNH